MSLTSLKKNIMGAKIYMWCTDRIIFSKYNVCNFLRTRQILAKVQMRFLLLCSKIPTYLYMCFRKISNGAYSQIILNALPQLDAMLLGTAGA